MDHAEADDVTGVCHFVQGVRAADCENHLHQLHICLPSREGHTRLLYRMSMDFMDWTRHVPGIQLFWKNIASQVRGRGADGCSHTAYRW